MALQINVRYCRAYLALRQAVDQGSCRLREQGLVEHPQDGPHLLWEELLHALENGGLLERSLAQVVNARSASDEATPTRGQQSAIRLRVDEGITIPERPVWCVNHHCSTHRTPPAGSLWIAHYLDARWLASLPMAAGVALQAPHADWLTRCAAHLYEIPLMTSIHASTELPRGSTASCGSGHLTVDSPPAA